MNYFELHIGDHSKTTQHLSVPEEAFHLRLTKAYFTYEQALPVELNAVYRLVRADTRSQRSAVDQVLQEFFTLAADGWHHPDYDAVLERYHAQQRAQSDAQENASQRQQRARARRQQLAAELRACGVSMPWNSSTEQLVAALEQACQTQTAPVTVPVTPPVTPDDTAITNSHTPVTNNQTPSTSGSTPPHARNQRAQSLVVLLTERGVTISADDPHPQRWADASVTDQQTLTALRIAQQRRAQRGSSQPITPGFINALLNDKAEPRPVGKRGGRLPTGDELLVGLIDRGDGSYDF